MRAAKLAARWAIIVGAGALWVFLARLDVREARGRGSEDGRVTPPAPSDEASMPATEEPPPTPEREGPPLDAMGNPS